MRRRRRGFAWWLGLFVALAVFATLFTSTAVNRGRPWAPLFAQRYFTVTDEAMLPTLQPGDRVWATKLDATTRPFIKRNMLVVFDDPNKPGRTLVRRVVALAGDTVKGEASSLVLNSKTVDEPWLTVGVPTNDFGPITVPDGAVYVMGDNRDATVDSRNFGPVKLAVLRYRV
jgi:signal peptidase I